MRWDDIPIRKTQKVTWTEFKAFVKSEELYRYTRFEINPSSYNVENMVGIIDNRNVIVTGERGGYGIQEYNSKEEAYGAALDTLRFRKESAVSAGNPGYYGEPRNW